MFSINFQLNYSLFSLVGDLLCRKWQVWVISLIYVMKHAQWGFLSLIQYVISNDAAVRNDLRTTLYNKIT